MSTNDQESPQNHSDQDPSDPNQQTLHFIHRIASKIYEKIDAGQLPAIDVLVRNLRNVTYDAKKGYLELGDAVKHRSLTASTVRTFAQTLRLLATSQTMVRHDDFATKREAYYISKNWDDCRFDRQSESDAIMDDIEAIASLHGLSREQLRFYAESHGGSVAGELTIFENDPATGSSIEIDCRRFGSGAYTIPRSTEHLRFQSNADFVLAIETGGMFQRLNYHQFWKSARCILVEMGGVPTRATRRFIRRLSDQQDLPVYCFVDCDPYGFANIYRTLKAGSGNAAHLNQFLSVPNARFLGVTPQDISDYGLEDATHPLTKNDIKRAEDVLKNDPFFTAHPAWIAAIKQLLSLGVRAEQQALAKWGLNYVIDDYLPKKISSPESFLP